ncbi:MAG TPA: hypothetical protein VNN79_05960 [Actinomycetota bacterium]|nr:hypothetical protein [Actinomycetota bacterium]
MGYENLAQRAASGDYELIEPLDWYIIEMLHDEGEMFAGLYPLGDTAETIAKKFTQVKGGLPVTVLSNRLRNLHAQNLVVRVEKAPGTAGKSIWQRTATGKKLYLAWKENLNGNSG